MDMFMRCQSRIQQVFTEHQSRLLDMERVKTASGIELESKPTSRMSAVPDSDSSRPTTSETKQAGEHNSDKLTDLRQDNAYRLEQLIEGNSIILDHSIGLIGDIDSETG